MASTFPDTGAPYPTAHADGTVWPGALKNYIDDQVSQALQAAVTDTDFNQYQQNLTQLIAGGLGLWEADGTGAFIGDGPDGYTHRLMVGKDSSDYTKALPGDLRLRVADADWSA